MTALMSLPRNRTMKIKNQELPTFDLVVTRHAPLVEWLRREGHIDASTPVVEHAHADVHYARVVQVGSGYEVHAGHRLLGHEVPIEATSKAFADRHNAANVRGKHVIGVLPHHLSSKAASVTEVQLDWSLADREAMQRGDLDVDAVHRAARGLHTYRVQEINSWAGATTHWMAIAAAYAYVEEHGQCFGCGAGRLNYITDRKLRGLNVAVIGDGAETCSAEFVEARGVWRPECRGPWLDGFGREVAEDSITPAMGWVQDPAA